MSTTPQVVTLELYAVDVTIAEAIYISTQRFVSASTDTPANTPFLPRIRGAIEYTREVSIPPFGQGRSSGAIGHADVDNTDGALDRWLAQPWRNRQARIRRGLATDALADHDHISYVVIDRISKPDLRTTRLHFRDMGALLDIPAHSDVYPELEQAPSLEGTPRPFCFGECEGVPLTLIDAALLQYDVDDEPPYAIEEVTDRGVILTEGTQWEVSTETGTYGITRLTNPAGTNGKQVARVRGSQEDSLSSVIAMLLERAAVKDPNIDPSAIDNYALADLEDATGYAYCYYGRDETTFADILTMLLNSVNGWWYYDRNNNLRVSRLDPPSTASLVTLSEINLIGDVTFTLDEGRGLSDSIGCARNWSPHSEGEVAGSVNALEPARAQRIKAPQQVRKGVNALHDTYAHARGAKPPPTLLATEADGQTEANHQTSLYTVEHGFYGCDAALDGSLSYTLEPGDVVTLEIDRYGLDAGKQMVVIAATTDLMSSIVRLVLRGEAPQAGDFPTGS